MTRAVGNLTLVLLAFVLGACGGGGSSAPTADPSPDPPPEPPTEPGTGAATCSGGVANGFPCAGVSLRSRVPVEAMNGTAANDIWGWSDPLTGREYALVGLTDGTAFVDVTDPESPGFLGVLPTRTVASSWRDIKVYRDHAYVVADNAGAHGMQVFDLRRLRGVTQPTTFASDNVYIDFEEAHNLVIDEDSGFAYAVGARGLNDCGHGLHMIDIRQPVNPLFAGCHSLLDTHDAQCVNYRGPDAAYAGRQLCFSSANRDAPDPAAPGDGIARLEIVDVTLKPSPRQLSASPYPDSGYAHQGWLTEDHRYFLLGDETDERDLNVPTRTHVFDVADPEEPQYLFAYEADTPSIDHNLYVLGDRVFQANYTSGLRVLEFGDLSAGDLHEIAYFDTQPASDAVDFEGAWSVYPYLPSGNILVSDQANGLFVLTLE